LRGKKKQHRKKQANPYKSFPEIKKYHVELRGRKKQHRKKQANPYKSFPELEIADL
jgi:heme-degrading monooxygenase HmoA